jgi:hypothetical protein
MGTVAKGEKVRVVAADGLRLQVVPVEMVQKETQTESVGGG